MNRPRFHVEFEAMPDPRGNDPARRLALLLRFALRTCRLKCLRAEQAAPPAETPTLDAEDRP